LDSICNIFHYNIANIVEKNSQCRLIEDTQMPILAIKGATTSTLHSFPQPFDQGVMRRWLYDNW